VKGSLLTALLSLPSPAHAPLETKEEGVSLLLQLSANVLHIEEAFPVSNHLEF
jgi:hypothetical protein